MTNSTTILEIGHKTPVSFSVHTIISYVCLFKDCIKYISKSPYIHVHMNTYAYHAYAYTVLATTA